MFLSGIDIGGTSIKFGIFDEQLNLLQQWSRPTPKEPAEAAALIAAQLEPYHVAAIGAGAPGTLNAARETITADNLAWVDVPLAALLRRASGLPAVVINDGHAAMLAEMRSGALQNVQTGILLTLGTGIGGGIVINGQCWRSPTGLAPELGHIITHSDGLPHSHQQIHEEKSAGQFEHAVVFQISSGLPHGLLRRSGKAKWNGRKGGMEAETEWPHHSRRRRKAAYQ